MLPKYLFRKPKITLEDAMNPNADAPSAPDKMYVSCPGCKAMLLASVSDLTEDWYTSLQAEKKKSQRQLCLLTQRRSRWSWTLW